MHASHVCVRERACACACASPAGGPFAFKCHRGGGTAQSEAYAVNALDFHPAVATAIRAFDAVVIGPGSFFTSLMPPLLVRGVADALLVAEVLEHTGAVAMEQRDIGEDAGDEVELGQRRLAVALSRQPPGVQPVRQQGHVGVRRAPQGLQGGLELVERVHTPAAGGLLQLGPGIGEGELVDVAHCLIHVDQSYTQQWRSL